jgi:anti-sigma regulatory factor (Ser/Thr protein kinase)
MREEDVRVATARWESESAIDVIATVRDGVAAFAAAHGMTRDTREDVGSCVSEAVADAVVRLRRGDERGNVSVEAATDGEWLSVQVKDAARARGVEPATGLPLVSSLPDRLDWAADAVGTYVLMEFAMGSGAPGVDGPTVRGAGTPRCGRRRRLRANRRPVAHRRGCR